MKNNELVVYWSPFNYDENNSWDMLYVAPEKVYSDLYKDKNKENTESSYFSCPAFKETTKNLYLIRNVMENEITVIDGIVFSSTYPNVSISHKESINNRPVVSISYPFIFFAEEPLSMTVTPPFMHPTGFVNEGHVVMGSFDIGKWFRPVNLDFMLYEKTSQFKFKDDEPLMYINFNTDKKIILKRFQITKEIHNIAVSCSQSHQNIKKFMSLSERYKLFIQSKTRESLLNKIKSNIIEEIA
jgi:hypothetical protein